MKKYEVRGDYMIDEIDVTKETDKTVTLANGNRRQKETEYHSIHDTFEDARARLFVNINANASKLEEQACKLRKSAAKAGKMTGPGYVD